MIYRDFDISIKATDEREKRSPVTFIASTDTPDRYGDIVGQNWELSAYERNPIILFNHNPAAMPIGKGRAYVEDGRLMIDVEFDQNDDDAKKIESKVRGGYINAVSVGFQPLEAVLRSALPDGHKYKSKKGYYYPKSELLEVSIVTIPANNEATLTAKNYNSRSVSLADVARSLVVNRHVISVEMLDDGNYVVTFAGHSEDMPEDAERMDEEEIVEEGYDKDEEKGGHDEEKADKDDEEETMSKSLSRLLTELKSFNLD
jgi:HK97 family phage prohead protease